MLHGVVGRGLGHVSAHSGAPPPPIPFLDAGPPGPEEAAWELSEEVFPLSLSFILG